MQEPHYLSKAHSFYPLLLLIRATRLIDPNCLILLKDAISDGVEFGVFGANNNIEEYIIQLRSWSEEKNLYDLALIDSLVNICRVFRQRYLDFTQNTATSLFKFISIKLFTKKWELGERDVFEVLCQDSLFMEEHISELKTMITEKDRIPPSQIEDYFTWLREYKQTRGIELEKVESDEAFNLVIKELIPGKSIQPPNIIGSTQAPNLEYNDLVSADYTRDSKMCCFVRRGTNYSYIYELEQPDQRRYQRIYFVDAMDGTQTPILLREIPSILPINRPS